jgi:hypothetical protein
VHGDVAEDERTALAAFFASGAAPDQKRADALELIDWIHAALLRSA